MRYNSDDPEAEVNMPDSIGFIEDDPFRDDPPEDDFADAYDRHIEILEKLDSISSSLETLTALLTKKK